MKNPEIPKQEEGISPEELEEIRREEVGGGGEASLEELEPARPYEKEETKEEKEEARLKELELMRERRGLEKAFEGSEKLGVDEFKKYIGQNLPERLEEKKKSWQEEINKSRTPRGEELTAAEKRSLERDFYLKELSDCSIKYEGGIKGTLRGFFTGKEKVRILKDGKPVEKAGKPLEFKVNWWWKHPEKDIIEFLKSEIENKTKEDLKKEWEERAKREAAKVVTQKEKSEPPKEEPKGEAVKKEEFKKEDWKGVDFKKMEAEKVFEKIKEMNMEKNAKDIIGIIKKYGPGIFLPAYIEKLLKQYDQQRLERYKFEKVKNNPRIIKKWLAAFLTDIKYPEKVKKLREIKLGVKKKEGVKEKVDEESKEEKTGKTEQVFSAESTVESTVQPEEETLLSDEEELERWPKKKKEFAEHKKLDWLEHAIKLRENGKFDIKMTNELKKFLKDRGITEEEIRRMRAVPEEAWEKAIEIYEKEQRETEKK